MRKILVIGLAMIIISTGFTGCVEDQDSKNTGVGLYTDPSSKDINMNVNLGSKISEYDYVVDYYWKTENDNWKLTLRIPKDLKFRYETIKRSSDPNYGHYVYYRDLTPLVNEFKKVGYENGYSDDKIAKAMICFVQSLPYTADITTTGFEEYPRYPVETLLYGYGDCEDTSILTAALLSSFGYNTVLIDFPDHIAVGIKCIGGYSGKYYNYKNETYYYLETTDEGWNIGEMPDEEANRDPIIRPLIWADNEREKLFGE